MKTPTGTRNNPAATKTLATTPARKAKTSRELKDQRYAQELELLNEHADELNADGDDSAAYQYARNSD